MRLLAASAVAAIAGLAVAAASAAPGVAARCDSQITAGGHHWLVAATVPCSVALPIARGLATARVTGHVVRNGVRITTFSSPRGWLCATPASNPRGRACTHGTAASVVIVLLG